MAIISNLVQNKLHPITGEDLKPTVVTLWRDGTTPMSDALCGGMYNKDTEPASPTFGSYFKWNSSGPYPVSRLTTVNQSNFQKLLNDFGSTPATILVDKNVAVTANLTIPANITLIKISGIDFNITGGAILTNNGINGYLPLNKSIGDLTGSVTSSVNFSKIITDNNNLEVTGDTLFTFNSSARRGFVNLNGTTFKNNFGLRKLLRSTFNTSITFSDDLDKIFELRIENGIIDNFEVFYTVGAIANINAGIRYIFKNITFKNCFLSLGTKNSKYNEFDFQECKFYNCIVNTYSLAQNRANNLTLSEWVSTKQFYFSSYYFTRCDFIAGILNNNNNELLHLADFHPLTKTRVKECNFYGFDDITSDYIDCYDGSNIVIENCFFVGKLGGSVSASLSQEPVFINVKAHPPSYDALISDSGLNDELPFVQRRNVVIKGNTFVPLQPNETVNGNTPAIIRCATFRRTGTTTTEYMVNRLFTEFSGNFIYLNNLNLSEFAIVCSLGGNQFCSIAHNKIHINHRSVNITNPLGVQYILSEPVTITNFALYRCKSPAATDPKLLDSNVFIDDNIIYNNSTSDFKIITANDSLSKFYLRNNILEQPNVAVSPYAGGMVMSNIFRAGNSFDPQPITSNVFTGSGTGVATTINIPHGLNYTPIVLNTNPNNAASIGVTYVTSDATNFIFHYSTPPATGTNNLSYNITYKQ